MENTKIDITFVVPCLNEERNLGNAIRNIINVLANFELSFEIIIVDDGSSDGTCHVARQLIAENKDTKISLVRNNRNMGIGRSYVDTAFLAKGLHFMLINGDNSETPESIAVTLEKIGLADMIIPYMGRGDNRRLGRKLISKIFTLVINLVSGNSIKYYNSTVLHKTFNVMRWSPDTNGYAYQAELICRIIEEGGTYQEIEISNIDRVEGKSDAFKFKNFLSVGHSISQIFFRRLRWTLFYKKG